MTKYEVIKDLQSRFEELQRIAKAWGAASGDVAHAARFVRLTTEGIEACREALAAPSYTTTRDTWTAKATYTCNKCGEKFDTEHRARYHQCAARSEPTKVQPRTKQSNELDQIDDGTWEPNPND